MHKNNIKHFEEKQAVEMLKQVMNGFAELRSRKVMHRDFKLANMFLHDKQVVIGDFGFAKSGADIARTKLGSPLTMAPELLFVNDDRVEYTSKADLWSIGVVFYELLFGEPPFYGLSINELVRNIERSVGDRLKFPLKVTEETKDLLRRMLVIDPLKRIEWSECFNHPVFARLDALNQPENALEELIVDIRGSTLGAVDLNNTIFELNR